MDLEAISREIYACRRCRLWQGAKHGVPGEGPRNAEVMLVGQNPGAEEDETGRPFVGRAGKYLTQVLLENGIRREDLYITNIVKHITPKNRRPLDDEIEACLPYLEAEISIVKPKVIVLLGKAACKAPRVMGVEYFEMVHPQAAARFPKMDKKLREQLKSLRIQRLI
ncbi:MAG: uracil-DNA glycosylase [Methanocella sp.]